MIFYCNVHQSTTKKEMKISITGTHLERGYLFSAADKTIIDCFVWNRLGYSLLGYEVHNQFESSFSLSSNRSSCLVERLFPFLSRAMQGGFLHTLDNITAKEQCQSSGGFNQINLPSCDANKITLQEKPSELIIIKKEIAAGPNTKDSYRESGALKILPLSKR